MKKLKIAVLDFLTDTPRNNWFQKNVLHPSFASVMPQCVAVWLEELGHDVHYDTYIGQDLFASIPSDIDVLFLSGFSRVSFLAYGVSQFFRKRGVITILGGSHARSYTEHAQNYFDYICLLTDKETVSSLISNLSRQPHGIVLDAKKQPKDLPSARQRERFIDVNIRKSSSVFKVVPMIGSFGCPYTCSFCIDATIPYRPLPYDGLRDDLRFAQQRWGDDSFIGWHDPNFGVRFRDYMGVIEESGTRLRHVAESTMSLLTEENLKILKKNRFRGALPGIESWYDFSNKSGQKRTTGEEKMRGIAEHINLIQSYIPYVQANFVLGLDGDPEGSWELTKKFLDLAPGAFPSFNLFTNFQNSPLSKEIDEAGRTLYMPFPLLDGYSAFNVKLKNYHVKDFYDRLINLMEYAWSPSAFYRRFRGTPDWTAKLINMGRGYNAGIGRLAHYRALRRRLDTDREFERFFEGEQIEPPQFYFDVIRERSGQYASLIPQELLNPKGFVASVQKTSFAAPVVPKEKLTQPAPAHD